MQYSPYGYGSTQGGYMGNSGGLMAEAPGYIRSAPPSNIINKAPHIDSPYIDRMLQQRQPAPTPAGPQLFPIRKAEGTMSPSPMASMYGGPQLGQAQMGTPMGNSAYFNDPMTIKRVS